MTKVFLNLLLAGFFVQSFYSADTAPWRELMASSILFGTPTKPATAFELWSPSMTGALRFTQIEGVDSSGQPNVVTYSVSVEITVTAASSTGMISIIDMLCISATCVVDPMTDFRTIYEQPLFSDANGVFTFIPGSYLSADDVPNQFGVPMSTTEVETPEPPTATLLLATELTNLTDLPGLCRHPSHVARSRSAFWPVPGALSHLCACVALRLSLSVPPECA